MVVMERAVINATKRTVIGKQVKALRREGKLPAVMYGHHIQAIPISLDLRDATRTLQEMTSSSLVTLSLDGVEHLALVAEKQRDYIRGTLKHIDFHIVSLKEKVHAQVAIELIGLAPAVKNFNGTVITNMDSLEVECFPQDLPEKFVIDLSKLEKIGDNVLVRDVISSETIEVMEDPESVVVVVVGAEAEEEEVVEEAVAAEPEVLEKGKKEEIEEEE